LSHILREAEQLVATGAREITLLGQNVNAYRDEDGATLAALLYRLSDIKGLKRLRYTTSHPRDMGEDLIEAHRDLDTLMPYLHLPVQSGSDRILKAMNRQHTAKDYLALIERIRGARGGDMALSSDFIVGFPGESDKDFDATLKLVREVKFASAFSFKYSPRPGTPASAAKVQVPEDVKSTRLETLQALLREQMEDFNAACVGRTLPVLIEKVGRKAGQAIGRSPYLQSVTVENADHLIGEIRDIRIAAVQPNSLKGDILEAVAV
jgi:tRNA-2-methylthio-N6-dimethylallyladenosine synthase